MRSVGGFAKQQLIIPLQNISSPNCVCGTPGGSYEGEISAAIAGHFGVPVIMVSGDDQVVKEVAGSLGNIEGAVVKWAGSFIPPAPCQTPGEANAVLREATQRAKHIRW